MMRPTTLTRALGVYCAAVACAGMFSVLRPNASAQDQRASRTGSRADSVVHRSPSEAARAVLASNPFLMPSVSGSAGDVNQSELPGPSVIPLDARGPQLGRIRLSAIVGPPWRAILSRDAPGMGPLVVEVGDSVQQSRVHRIVADTVMLKKASTITRRIIGESWEP
jgi:hypothetical protein